MWTTYYAGQISEISLHSSHGTGNLTHILHTKHEADPPSFCKPYM